jgi:hypothetical protein
VEGVEIHVVCRYHGQLSNLCEGLTEARLTEDLKHNSNLVANSTEVVVTLVVSKVADVDSYIPEVFERIVTELHSRLLSVTC